MRGYLQRLVESHSPVADAPAVAPALRSASPIADGDQRLTLDKFPDAVSTAPRLDSTTDGPPAFMPSELQSTRPSLQPPSPPRIAASAPAASPVRAIARPSVQRRAAAVPAPAAASAPPVNAAVAFAPPPAVRTEVASRPEAAPNALPASPAATRPIEPAFSLETRTRAAPAAAAAAEPVALPVTPRVRELSQPLPAEHAPASAQPTGEFRPAALRAPEVTTRPVLTMAEVAPEPQVQLPRLAETWPRKLVEPAVHRPRSLREDRPETRVVVREVPRSPDPPMRNALSPAPKAPRTAAEASVIGPLGRPERLLAQLDLRLR